MFGKVDDGYNGISASNRGVLLSSINTKGLGASAAAAIDAQSASSAISGTTQPDSGFAIEADEYRGGRGTKEWREWAGRELEMGAGTREAEE